nr:Sir2 silent information regulator family NAD-dependent deacetylase [Maliibacterium massiliense]
MFSHKPMRTSTDACCAQIDRLAKALAHAEAVIVGAGAGMSAAAGLTYDGARFEALFGDFRAKYGIQDIYSGGFYPFATPEECWAWWSRHIYYNRYDQNAGAPYLLLRKLLAQRAYFIITTNVDHQFQLAGFDADRLFCTQGDYGLWQCVKPCHDKTYDNEAAVRQMLAAQRDMRIPSALVPRCPVCGGPMAMNLRCDLHFVEDAHWHASARRYADFLGNHAQARVLYLELGVGGNTPGIIKYPFWQMTLANPRATYACINLGEACCPDEIAQQAICLDADIGDVLRALCESAG